VVVGIVKDIRNGGPIREAQPELYLVRRAGSSGNVLRNLAVRTNTDPAVMAVLLRQIVADLDHELPVNIQTVDSQVANLTARPRFVAWLLAAFAGVALLLAATGLYGVAAYLVTQRTRDIGVRMALGATQGNIVRQLLGETARWIVAGLLLGLCLAWASAQALKSQLVSLSAADGLSWAVALAILLAALLIAVLRPAARAAGVNPVDALRAE
jgi:predicted lysophospholipase L1 biosynthesis ABC-type transport system permease subunit